MNIIRTLVEAVADRIHAPGDLHARTQGLTVERLPWGHRRIYDPRVPAMLQRRRHRIAATGGDPLDRALAAADPHTAQAITDTARTMATDRPTRTIHA